jgi:hypothetical protein
MACRLMSLCLASLPISGGTRSQAAALGHFRVPGRLSRDHRRVSGAADDRTDLTRTRRGEVALDSLLVQRRHFPQCCWSGPRPQAQNHVRDRLASGPCKYLVTVQIGALLARDNLHKDPEQLRYYQRETPELFSELNRKRVSEIEASRIETLGDFVGERAQRMCYHLDGVV